jgi:hypothetical protein
MRGSYPNGIMSPSPGLAGGTTAYPGNGSPTSPNPNGVVSDGYVKPGNTFDEDGSISAALVDSRYTDTTPLGLTDEWYISGFSQGRYFVPTLG